MEQEETRSEAVVEETGPGEEQAGAPEVGLTAGQLARLREVLVATHPETVPELIAGASFDALLASLEPARAAYRRVREESERAAVAGVPRGGGVREPDAALFAGLAPEAKIAVALDQAARR